MVKIKHTTNRKLKEKVIEEEYSSLKLTKEEVPLSKYKKMSSGITISEPATKKKKSMDKPTSVKKNIFIPRYIQRNSFSNLDFELIELFEFQGWKNFMRINEDYYANLIKEFYESLEEVEKNEVFRIKIRGQMHDISIDIF